MYLFGFQFIDRTKNPKAAVQKAQGSKQILQICILNYAYFFRKKQHSNCHQNSNYADNKPRIGCDIYVVHSCNRYVNHKVAANIQFFGKICRNSRIFVVKLHKSRMTSFSIQSLQLKNCGPIQDMFLDFRDKNGSILQTVVIGGANGSGKTTILEMIVEMGKGLFHYFNKNKRVNGYLDITKKYIECNIEFCVDDKMFTLDPSKYIMDELMGLQNLMYPYVKTMIGDISQFMFDKKNILPNKNNLPPSILFFPHTRFISDIKGEQLFKVEPTYQFIYKYENISHFKDSYDAFFTWLDYAEPAICEEILGFVNGIDFNGKKFFIDRKNLQVKVQTANNETHLLAEMSSGEQNIFILLLELQLRLTPHSIVLIDEIENSLHPAYQQLLAYSLTELQKKTPFQLIVTTHSKEFIKFFGADKVRYITTL